MIIRRKCIVKYPTDTLLQKKKKGNVAKADLFIFTKHWFYKLK